MGYSTTFEGRLDFTQEPTADQLAELQAMFAEDCRDHPEWDAPDLYYVDLELTKDFRGIQWNGAEKTYYLERVVNVVLAQMRKTWPEFGLSGQMTAQGESLSDRWALVIGADGLAAKQKVATTGRVVRCPHCGDEFALEGVKP